MKKLLLIYLLVAGSFTLRSADFYPSSGGKPGGSNTQIQYNNNGSFGGAANLGVDANGNLVGSSTTAHPVLSLTENGTNTGSPSIGQLAPIELNIKSAGVNARDVGLVFKGYGSGTSGLPGSGGFNGVFFGFDGDNVFVMGNGGYPGATGTPRFAFLTGTNPEIFDKVEILDNTGGGNGTAELKIAPTGFAHTGPAIDVWTRADGGSSVFSIDNPTGNTLIAGTLGVTGHITAEGVTSTGATGTGKLVFATLPSITTGINDANGNSILAFTATASAVDGFTFTNAATAGHQVTMAASGSDTNIDLKLAAKGSGDVISSVGAFQSGNGYFKSPSSTNINIYPGSGGNIVMNPNQNNRVTFQDGLMSFTTDNTYDIGASGATRPRDLFLGRNLNIAGASTLTGGIVGTTTNDNAAALNVGQEIESLKDNAHTVSLSNGTAADVTSVSLTAGDWDVEGNVNFTETTSTVTARSAGISTTSATLPTDGSEAYCGVQSTVTSETNSITLPRKRVSIASTTTVYLVGKATFSAGTCAEFGGITARRVR